MTTFTTTLRSISGKSEGASRCEEPGGYYDTWSSEDEVEGGGGPQLVAGSERGSPAGSSVAGAVCACRCRVPPPPPRPVREAAAAAAAFATGGSVPHGQRGILVSLVRRPASCARRPVPMGARFATLRCSCRCCFRSAPPVAEGGGATTFHALPNFF